MALSWTRADQQGWPFPSHLGMSARPSYLSSAAAASSVEKVDLSGQEVFERSLQIYDRQHYNRQGSTNFSDIGDYGCSKF